MFGDQQAIMDVLKDKGPEGWREYLRPFEEGASLTGLSMQAIFHYAARLARSENSIAWAEVAVRAAELEARDHSGVERENARLWAMNLRAFFISRMGPRSNHLVLDKSIIVEWIIGGLKLPLQTTRQKAILINEKLAAVKAISGPEEKRQMSEDLRELRAIKRRLNVAKLLAACGELPSDSALKEWIELREQLP